MRSISMRASPARGRVRRAPRASATSIVSLSASSAMRSMTLRSSRTLPGHGRRSSQAIALSVKRSLRGSSRGERGDELGDVLDALARATAHGW